MKNFRIGDVLLVEPVPKGITKSAPAGSWVKEPTLVVAKEEGVTGGWDVYDVLTKDPLIHGTDATDSVYGFQIRSIWRKVR